MAAPSILFNDFKAEYAELHDELHQAINRVLSSGYFLLGLETQAFETELAVAMGRKFSVAVANGTEALAIALIIAGVNPGDEVIVPALTAYPTIIALELAHAIPVVCEVDKHTGLLDPSFLEALITKKTAAIVPVHLYGQTCDMKKIAKIAKAHQIPIVEDCAQAIFAKHENRQAGDWSIASAVSFYPSKNLGAYGDAGAVLMDDPELHQHALRLRQYGQTSRYIHQEFGFNSRIDELQAAILRVKLPHTPRWIQRRQNIAQLYLHQLNVGKALKANKKSDHTYHLFVTRLRNRDHFMQYCQDHQIPAIVHYPRTVYQQPAFNHHQAVHCPNAEALVDQIISLPIHPYLSDDDVSHICSVLNKYPK